MNLPLNTVVARGGLFAISGLIGGSFFSFGATAVIVKYATTEAYGDYASISAAVMLCAFAARFGIDRLAVREIRRAIEVSDASAQELTSQLMVSAAFVAAGVVVVGAVVLSVIVLAVGSAVALLSFTIAWAALEAARPIVMEILRSRLRLGASTAVGPAGRATVLLIGTLISVLLGRTETLDFVVVAMIATAASTAFGFFSVRRVGTASGGKVIGDAARLLRHRSSTLRFFTLSGVGTLVIGLGDVIVVRIVGSNTDAGAYGSAVALAAAVGLVMTSVNTTISPVIQSLISTDRAGVASLVLRSITTVASIAAAVVWVITSVTAWGVLPALGGGDFDGAFRLVVILGAGQLAGVTAGPCGTVLLLAGQERYVSLVIAVTAFCAIIIEFLLMVMTSSLTAVAVVSGSAVLVHNFVLERRVRSHLGFSTAGIAAPLYAFRTVVAARTSATSIHISSDGVSPPSSNSGGG